MSQSFNVPHSLSVMMTLLLGVLVTFLMTKTIYNLVMAVYKARFRRGASHLSKTTDAASFMIEKLRFMIFVKFFSNCLTVSFLSQYILHLAQLAGAKANLASLAYVIYTLIFALMIVPGGYLVEVKNVKLTLVVMLALEAVVFFVLGVTHCFWLIFIIQALFGMIIPVSSSAEYAYLFVFSSEQNRSHTLALYNNTVKGAMISGVFLGGLILPYLHEQGVFLLACTLVLFCAVYAGLFIPKIDIDEKKRQTLSRRFLKKAHFKEVFKHIPIIIKDSNFILSSVFVSFPLGFITEGIVFFAFPILLNHYHFPRSLIGSIMVLFSLGFFLSNRFISKHADQKKQEKHFMAWGLFGCAFSIVLISMYSLLLKKPFISSQIALWGLMIGLFALGVFRGFMLSPSTSLVSKSKTAKLLGKNVAVSFYRLFEFIGRTMGPLVISCLFLTVHYSSLAFLVVGVVCLLFGFVLNRI